MGTAKEYSKRLGEISDAQFEAVAERWNLGRFVGAEPITNGLFGQNVFINTTQGGFVLRGAPHWVKGPGDSEWRREDRWQFTKEKFFARRLHEDTAAPAPWPMLHDEASDIFGWPYLVMPRMPGHCFDERSIRKELDAPDRRDVAVAMGEMLGRMQTLTWPFAGDFSQNSITLEPYPDGAFGHTVAETLRTAREAEKNGSIASSDIEWIELLAAVAQDAANSRASTYVHCDYKLNNMTVMKVGGVWRVSGLFDFHEARFADGALDIVRQACSHLDTESSLAKAFIDAYRACAPADPSLVRLMPLYVANDRMKFWEFFTRPEAHAEWAKGKTYREWAQRYIDDILKIF